MGRRLICRRDPDDVGVTARAGPEHQADRHRVRQFRLDVASEVGVLLFVLAQYRVGVVGGSDKTRGDIDFRAPDHGG